MRILFISLFLLISSLTSAQKFYYLGFDIGPKVDLYQLASGTKAYMPNMAVSNDMAAVAGLTGGVLVDDKFLLETGIFRSNFKTRIQLFDEIGRDYFFNDPINTFDAYMIPVHFDLKLNSSKVNWQFFAGMGFTTFINSKLSIVGTKVSVQEYVDLDRPELGYMQYTISENQLTGTIMALNLNFKAWYSINENLFFNFGINGRYGTSGESLFDLNLISPEGTSISNTVYTAGNALQATIGFRIFFDELPTNSSL